MDSGHLQRGSVSQSDHTVAGGSQKPFLTGKLTWNIPLRVQAIWKAGKALKKQDELGASSKGQRLPGRPYDSGTDPDTNSDRESLES